ncbi:putative transcriptional regulator (IclR family) [Peptoniphilus sp. ING2-D1G]|nr:putative transcriptional regulator (IclR family) [Peptoniphilus sp. ING2-D1G]
MIQSLQKAVNILEYMKIENREYSISEISENLDMPTSTTHRILNTLIKCDFVTKDIKSHLYKLGPGLISLGMAAALNISLQSEAKPILESLSKKTLEDSFLVIKSGNYGIVIGKAVGSHTLKVIENFGREIELHKGAIRKVILAYQSDEFIEQYLSRDLEPYIDKEVNKKELRKELESIKQKKYCNSFGEYISNTAGIGAPVFNYQKEFVGSIGIVVPYYRFNNNESSFIEAVVEASEKLSYKLGYYNPE